MQCRPKGVKQVKPVFPIFFIELASPPSPPPPPFDGGLSRWRQAPPPPPLPPLPPFPGPYDESVGRLHRLYRLSLAAYSEMSIDRGQDSPDIIVLKHILPQQVVMPGADIRQLLVATERHMAVRIEAGSYTQSVS